MKKKGFLAVSLFILLTLAICLSGCFFNDSSNDYTITFYADGKVHDTIVITPQTTQITMPSAPVKEGYIFEAWYFDKDIWKNKFTEESLAKIINSNIKLYAKFNIDPQSLFHTVSFKVDGKEVRALTISEGESIPYTFTPTKTGYNFIRWAHSSGSLPTVMGKENIEINAVFSANTYNIYFETDTNTSLTGQSLINQNNNKYITVTYDSPYAQKLNSIVARKTGYDFAYWKHLDGEYTTESIYKTAGNITLTPVWAKIGTAGLKYNYISDAGFYEVTGYTGAAENIIIPMKYDDGINGKRSVSTIRNISNYAIESIEIQNSVTKIYESAFADCLNLQSVTIASSVKIIQTDVFPPDSNIILYCKTSEIQSEWASDWHCGNTVVFNNEQYESKVFDISNPVDVTAEAKFVPQSIMISNDGIEYSKIPSESYTISGFTITLSKQYLSQKTEGTFTIRLYGELSAYFVLDIFNEMFSLVYDKAEGGDFTRNFSGKTLSALYGGGITSADYTVTNGSFTLKQNYLMSLKGGEYELLLKGENAFAETLTLSVYDSECTPYNVKLDCDINLPSYTILFDCDCQDSSAHFYSIDGGSFLPCQSGDTINHLSYSTEHTLTVKCNASGNSSQPYTLQDLNSAAAYLTEQFSWGSTNYNKYITDQNELNIFIAYLVHKGAESGTRIMSNANKPYGYVEDTIYISDVFKSEFISDGSRVLNAANRSFDFPWSFSTSSSLIDNEATFTVTYTTEPAAKYSTGQNTVLLADNRIQLTGNRSPFFNDFAINNFIKSEEVDSVQELDSLPYGVKPVFTASEGSLQALAVYNSVLNVCRSYINDSMTDYQKVIAFYDWLSINVTYDNLALRLMDLQTLLENTYNLQSAKNHISSALSSTAWDVALTAALADVRDNASTVIDIRNGVSNIIKGLKVFHLQGVFEDGIAVCDGIASAFKLMCLIEGIDCIEVTGWAGEAHAWNKVKIDGKLYVVDATWGRLKINSMVTMSHQWLLVTDKTALTGQNPHIEKNSYLQSCIDNLSTGEYDYYSNTLIGGGYNLVADTQAELNAIIAYYYGLGYKTAELRYNAGGNNPENDIQTAVMKIKNISFSFIRPGNDKDVWVIDISNLYT